MANTVNIRLNLEGVKRVKEGFGELNSRSKRLGQTLQSVGDRGVKLGQTMSARVTAPMAAATAGIGALINRTTNAAKEIKNLSAISNTSTTEFQRMAFAAKSVGLEQDKVGDILKDVNDKVGDFLSTGGGPLKDFFEEIAPQVGVTAEEFRGLSGKQSLQLFVDTLEKANVGQQEMTFQMEALASDATALLPIMRDNGERMRELGNEAERTGAILSEKTIEASVEASRKMDLLKQNASNLTTQIGAALLPVFNDFAGWMQTKGIPAMRGATEQVKGMIQWFSDLPGPVKQAAGTIATALGTGGPVLIALGTLSKVIGGLIAATGPIGLFIAAASTLYSVWSSNFGSLSTAVKNFTDYVGQLFESTQEKIESVNDEIVRQTAGKYADMNNDASGEAEEMRRNVVSEFQRLQTDAERRTFLMKGSVLGEFREINDQSRRITQRMESSVNTSFGEMASGVQESTDQICGSISNDFQGCASDAQAIAGLMESSVLEKFDGMARGAKESKDKICASVNDGADGFRGCASDAQAIAGLMEGSVLDSFEGLRRGATSEMETTAENICRESEEAKKDVTGIFGKLVGSPDGGGVLGEMTDMRTGVFNAAEETYGERGGGGLLGKTSSMKNTMEGIFRDLSGNLKDIVGEMDFTAPGIDIPVNFSGSAGGFFKKVIDVGLDKAVSVVFGGDSGGGSDVGDVGDGDGGGGDGDGSGGQQKRKGSGQGQQGGITLQGVLGQIDDITGPLQDVVANVFGKESDLVATVSEGVGGLKGDVRDLATEFRSGAGKQELQQSLKDIGSDVDSAFEQFRSKLSQAGEEREKLFPEQVFGDKVANEVEKVRGAADQAEDKLSGLGKTLGNFISELERVPESAAAAAERGERRNKTDIDSSRGIFPGPEGSDFNPVASLISTAVSGVFGGFGGIPSFQRGGSFIASEPRLIEVGEMGSERVSVEPLTGGGSDAGGVNVIFNGPTVLDEMSMAKFERRIAEAVRKGRR